MATATALERPGAAPRPMTAEERKVIVASSPVPCSNGTTSIWPARSPRTSPRTSCPAQRHGEVHLRVVRLRRRLCGPSVRRAVVRPSRRPDRPQVHLPRHHDDHGPRDLRRRPPARLHFDRLRRAGASSSAGWSRASPSAANTAAPRPTSPSTRPRDGAASNLVDPDDRDRRAVPVARRHPDAAPQT